MKKALILAYDFPPYVSVGGLRPYGWYKYLVDYGVYPIIVTRQWQNRYKNHLDYIAPGESDDVMVEKTETGTILRTPYKPNLANRLYLRYGEKKFGIIRRAISAFYEFSQFFFPIGPKIEIFEAADTFLQTEKVDVIIASGDPFILFKYASILGKKHHIPWIADYRDPWAKGIGLKKNPLLKAWNTTLEKKFLKRVSHITTVSDFVKTQISYPQDSGRFSIIPNGYDPEIVSGIDLSEQNKETFSIALAGSIFDWHPLRSFLKVYTEFILSVPETKSVLNFYGVNIAQELGEIIENDFPEIKAHVNIYPKMANALLMPLMAKNNAFLLFNYYSFMGTKIYDYLALKRNILLCYSNDPGAEELKRKYFIVDESNEHCTRLQEQLILQTHSGYVVENENHLAQLLRQLHQEFIEDGQLHFDPLASDSFSRKKQTGELAKIIHTL